LWKKKSGKCLFYVLFLLILLLPSISSQQEN